MSITWRGPTPWPDINKIQEMIFDGRLDVLAAELIICGLKAVDEMNLVMSRLVFSTRNVGPESLNLRIIFAAWALNGFYLSTCCQKMKVSGVGCQGKEMLDTETSYETTPKWHSFFFDQTGRFSGQRRRLYETS